MCKPTGRKDFTKLKKIVHKLPVFKGFRRTQKSLDFETARTMLKQNTTPLQAIVSRGLELEM
jgi:type II restriction/modification system DNA methylase subunit YeeA